MVVCSRAQHGSRVFWIPSPRSASGWQDLELALVATGVRRVVPEAVHGLREFEALFAPTHTSVEEIARVCADLVTVALIEPITAH